MENPFGGYDNNQIASVTFLDSLSGAPADAWDASENGDRSVLGWAVPNGDLYDITIAGDGGVSASSASNYGHYLFYLMRNVRSIRFNGCFDTSNVTSMHLMFGFCDSLVELDLSGIDTSNVTSMEAMFAESYSLEEIDLSRFDTSNVTNMEAIFYCCKSLRELDLSGFDTSNVTTMMDMFGGCYKLETLDLSGFDTSNVENMREMFGSCHNLKSLDIRSFDTSKVTKMTYMFSSCEVLPELDLRSFNTENTENMTSMFKGSEKLKRIVVGPEFVIGEDTYKDGMFDDCGTDTFTVSDVPPNWLQRGDKGERVKKLQEALISRGMLSGSADGDFGAKTEAAVKKLQQSLFVAATGIADDFILNLLLDE